jgi:uncharacterized damage-inducible protein DinB
MSKITIESVPSFYRGYVNHVMDRNFLDAMHWSSEEMKAVIWTLPESKGDYSYAPGKWTIREMLGHIIDAERIFAYRALRFARNDKTQLSGFDENAYVPESNASTRKLKDLMDELGRIRQTSIDLYKSFTPAMLERTGSANNTEMSVLALAYIIPGHETHHRTILKTRYL